MRDDDEPDPGVGSGATPHPPSPRRGGRVEEQRGVDVAPGSWWPDAALAQVAGPALAGQQRHGGVAARRRRPSPRPAARRRAAAAGEGGSARRRPGAARRASSCRPRAALPRATTPSSPARSAAANAGAVELARVAGRRRHRRKNVPYSGPLAPPTVLTSVIPACLSSAAGARPAAASSARDRRHPAAHVRAVVGVADGRVEPRELVGVSVTASANERSQRPRLGRAHRLRHSDPPPEGRVSTGASHSRSSSSSSLSSETERRPCPGW